MEQPGWSSAFAPEAVRELEPLRPVEEISPEWAWGGSTGKGVKVAILDSGVDASHPAVGPISGYVTVSQGLDGFDYGSEPHNDDYGHGTACAGIIRRVAPECDIYSVKVLGPNLLGQGMVFAAGLRWAIDNQMNVVNLSLGTTKKDFYALLHELADMAYFHNTALVTAANNMTLPSFPSTYAAVISVASHEVDDPYLFYYNPSPPVEFGAPGIGVRVPWVKGQWIRGTGNSYAAPHITGLVAKILGKHPGLTPFQVKTILRATARNVQQARPSHEE